MVIPGTMAEVLEVAVFSTTVAPVVDKQRASMSRAETLMLLTRIKLIYSVYYKAMGWGEGEYIRTRNNNPETVKNIMMFAFCWSNFCQTSTFVTPPEKNVVKLKYQIHAQCLQLQR